MQKVPTFSTPVRVLDLLCGISPELLSYVGAVGDKVDDLIVAPLRGSGLVTERLHDQQTESIVSAWGQTARLTDSPDSFLALVRAAVRMSASSHRLAPLVNCHLRVELGRAVLYHPAVAEHLGRQHQGLANEVADVAGLLQRQFGASEVSVYALPSSGGKVGHMVLRTGSAVGEPSVDWVLDDRAGGFLHLGTTEHPIGRLRAVELQGRAAAIAAQGQVPAGYDGVVAANGVLHGVSLQQDGARLRADTLGVLWQHLEDHAERWVAAPATGVVVGYLQGEDRLLPKLRR